MGIGTGMLRRVSIERIRLFAASMSWSAVARAEEAVAGVRDFNVDIRAGNLVARDRWRALWREGW